MIQISKSQKKIFFLREGASSVLKETEDQPEPLAFDLLSGYICPHCDSVVQAVYRTDKRLKELSKERYKLKEGLGPSKFAVSRPNHQVTPQYHSFLLSAGGDTAELIRESYHFDYNPADHSGRCIYKKAIFNPAGFDLPWYLYALANILGQPSWFGFQARSWSSIDDVLKDPTKTAKFYEAIRGRITRVEDVLDQGPPLWLVSKQGWNYYSFETAAREALAA